MSASITVLTVTIPGREQLLVETIQSVYAQTVPVERQLVCAHRAAADLDSPVEAQVQYSAAKNDLLRAVATDFVAVLNDDDIWFPEHIETVEPHLHAADVIWTWDAGGTRPRFNVNDWSRERLAAQLDVGNVIDGNCLIRTSALRATGGFPVDWEGPGPRHGGHYVGSVACWEDWRLWQKLLALDARFLQIAVVTWRYRMGSPNQICG